MTVPRRVALFALVLAAAFGAAAWAGAAIDPTEDRLAASGHGGGRAGPEDGAAGDHTGADEAAGHPGSGAGEGHGASGGDEAGAANGDGHAGSGAGTGHGDAAGGHGGAALGGLAVAQDGLTLALDDAIRPRGAGPLRFRVLDAAGRALTGGFEVEHAKRLHLIVVRRDTAQFRHLHPRLRADGTWETEADLPEAGDYRVFADFRRDGAKHTLVADLAVPGRYEARPWPAPADAARADSGGFDVSVESGAVRAGKETTLRFAVTRGGAPVDELQPYLGAKGHLVALREGDLGYLHVHPVDAEHAHGGGEAQAGHANEVAFAATFPTAGRYRLFLQFKARDAVRTVATTVEVGR